MVCNCGHGNSRASSGAKSADAKDAAWDRKYSDPREFVKLKFRHGFPRRQARRLIKMDKLPSLYEMLEDPNYAPYWHNTAKLICYISDDPNSSVPVLLRYFKRDDSWNWKSDDRKRATTALAGKIGSLTLIGELGGPQADPILQKAATEVGAAELAKAWIDKQMVPAMSWLKDKQGAIVQIRYAACRGLIYTEKTDNVKIARLYETETARCRAAGKRTKLWGYLRSAMATQDYFAEHGRNAYFSMSITENRAAMSQYTKKYSWKSKQNR